MWYEWWYQKENVTRWNTMTLEQLVLYIGVLVAFLLVTFIVGKLLNWIR